MVDRSDPANKKLSFLQIGYPPRENLCRLGTPTEKPCRLGLPTGSAEQIGYPPPEIRADWGPPQGKPCRLGTHHRADWVQGWARPRYLRPRAVLSWVCQIWSASSYLRPLAVDHFLYLRIFVVTGFSFWQHTSPERPQPHPSRSEHKGITAHRTRARVYSPAIDIGAGHSRGGAALMLSLIHI